MLFQVLNTWPLVTRCTAKKQNISKTTLTSTGQHWIKVIQWINNGIKTDSQIFCLLNLETSHLWISSLGKHIYTNTNIKSYI